jgi:cell wall assembly regulator SMI1
MAGIGAELERAKRILAQHGVALEFAAGASTDELARAARVTGLSFDNALGELYAAVNGSLGKTCFAVRTDEVRPCSLTPLEESLARWSDWLPQVTDRDARTGPAGASRDPHHIRWGRYVSPIWFPFARSDGWATTVYFNLDTDVEGGAGRVIASQRDPDAIHSVADSLAEFLSLSNTVLERHARDLL